MIPLYYDDPVFKDGSDAMRGDDQHTGAMFSYLSSEQRVPADHRLRPIRRMTDDALRRMSAQLGRLYAATGRPSVPPEQLLRVLLLQVLYSVRSERMLMEQLEYNLLFRWFVGLSMDDAVWVPAVFTKNRDRLLAGEVAIAQVAALPPGHKTVGGDKGFDQRAFVDAVRATGATPHVAAKTRYSAVDSRTTRHSGYAVSQRVRKRIEEIFGWMKPVGLLRKLRHRGVERVNWIFVSTAAAYNLVRMRTLAARSA